MRHFSIGLSVLLLLLLSIPSKADEGFWVPSLLSKYRMEDIKKAGFKLTKEDIYSINKKCIKDAVVGLSSEGMGLKNFCTASFVSGKGLLTTNYHCVMRYIEQYSNPEHDLLANGYWADTTTRELRCFELKVNQLVEIRDITKEITAGLEKLSAADYDRQLDIRGKEIVAKATKGTKLEGGITAFMGGNQYLLALYKVFEDVRLVGVPPISLGKFGGDSDNWQWPRHTGDFAFLRVYANSDNNPAKWRTTNQPYKPNHFLPISTKGLKENDFAMVVGFPSSSRRYIPSFALEQIVKDDNQHRIAICEAKMKIMSEAMETDANVKFRYTTRMSSMMNKLLKWKGELYGITVNGIDKNRLAEEEEFTKWVNASPERIAKYGGVLDSLRVKYRILSMYNRADLYFNEAGINGAEAVPFAGKFEKLVSIVKSGRKSSAKAAEGEARHLKTLLPQIYSNWNTDIDQKVFGKLLGMYYKNLPSYFHPEYMVEVGKKYNGDFEKFAEDAFKSTILTDSSKVSSFLDSVGTKGIDMLTNDPIYKMAIGLYMTNVNKIIRQRAKAQDENGFFYTRYLAGIIEMRGLDNLYSDANSTMRISYGKVKGVSPNNGVIYSCSTTADGMYEKRMKNSDNADYKMPVRLKELIEKKDFGKYFKGDKLPICFLSSSHTSSGNSGSPVIDAKGKLIGINFDRIWQGAYSDYQYTEENCRNICVDSRFILFFLEKFAKSDYILNELVVQ
ncbi:S46 family peptidase [uncultured Acetobacteroides sp.]|uniref:S46 family peptidase n=1 Tax=uncultured Acetobacteroides sp. TaxID=1760811 RepID=UPI0029F47F8C|nr:S46 family peptidase [uncultured Acetobacteroides sp.]